MSELIINSKKDIFDNLILAQKGDIPDDIKINFSDSLSYEFIIKGNKFGKAEGGGVEVPARILYGLIELQTTLQNAYALSKYGKIKDLTEEEKSLTEFNITFEHSHSVQFILKGISNSLKNIASNKKALGITGTLFIYAIYATPINTVIESAANIYIANIEREIAMIEDSKSRYIVDKKLEIAKENNATEVYVADKNLEATQTESEAKEYVADKNFESKQLEVEIAKIQQETILKRELYTDGKVKSITLKNDANESQYDAEEVDDERKEFVITGEEFEYVKIINDIASKNKKLKNIQEKCFNAQRSIYESLEDDEICVIDGQSLDNTQIKRLFKEEKEKKNKSQAYYNLASPKFVEQKEKIFDEEFDIIQIKNVRKGFEIKLVIHGSEFGNNYKFKITVLEDASKEEIKQFFDQFSVRNPIHLKIKAIPKDRKFAEATLISVNSKPDDTAIPIN